MMRLQVLTALTAISCFTHATAQSYSLESRDLIGQDSNQASLHDNIKTCSCPPQNCNNGAATNLRACQCRSKWTKDCLATCPDHKIEHISCHKDGKMIHGPPRKRTENQLVVPLFECGSRGLPGCKNGKICVRAPGASCGPETDCGGICVNRAMDPIPKAQCGSRGLPGCDAGFKCVRLPGRTCGPETDCGGMCVKDEKSTPSKLECGSRGTPGCKAGFQCVKLPGATCGPEVDCGGICVKSDPKPTPKSECGTRGAPGCKADFKCVKRPGASCGPEADCGGICTPIRPLKARAASDSDSSPVFPEEIKCSRQAKQNACPANQACVKGACVGAECNLRPAKESQKRRCPTSQTCVQRPREDGAIIFDVGGVCASKEMQCLTNRQCPQGFICQKQPNGDGVLCGEKEDCGLCAPAPWLKYRI